MSNATSANSVSILQRLYGEDMAEHEFDEDPLVKEMQKKTTGYGEGRHVVCRVSQVGGVGPTFAIALANKKPTGEKRFLVSPKRMYVTFGLDGLFFRQAKGKPNSLIRGYDGQLRSAMRNALAERDRLMWGDAGGSIGQLSASTTLASTTALFRQPRSLFSFYPTNRRITFSSDNGTPTSPAGERGVGPVPTSLLVTGTDFTALSGTIPAGSVTTDALLNTVPSITVNDFVFYEGYYGQTMSGLRGWCPITAPTAGDNFFGVDRSTDPQLLSGWRQLAKSNFELTCISALALAAQASIMGNGLRIYANTEDWVKVVAELGAKYQRQPTDSKQVAGAKGIEVYGPRGTATIFGSNLAPPGNGWLGDPKSITLLSEGPFPDILDEDGLGKIVRSPTDDSYDTRLGGYANQVPNDSKNELGPGGWVIITWPTS